MQSYNGQKYIQFHSNAVAPYHCLSNLSYISGGITFGKFTYPSVEHAYQAVKFMDCDKHRFTICGDLGGWDGMKLIYPNDHDNKIRYWSKKNNIGIIAKLAVRLDNIKKLNLTLDKTIIMQKINDKIWPVLLTKKFQEEKFKDILIKTGKNYLLEFSRSAKIESERNRKPYYNGLIEDGILYGDNKMGQYLMQVRSELNKK